MKNCAHMRYRTLFAVLCSGGLLCLVGCTGSSSLPETVSVNLPDGTQAEVTLGAGVVSLADTSWDLYQVYDGGVVAGSPFVRITFGPNGELSSFDNNTFVTELFGDQILFDGERHDTIQPPVTYEAATYGAETSDASGFSFVGYVNVFEPVAGMVAEATVMAQGQYDAEDPNLMTGSFSFSGSTTDLPGIPAQTFEDAMDFVARRVK